MRWTIPALAFLAPPTAATESVLLRGSRRLPDLDFDRKYRSGELGECQGDCDDDDDCLPGLRCFQRLRARQSVPGCTGTPFKKKDYCYDPAAKPLVLLYIYEEDRDGPLNECEGSCDDDDDCGGDLLCFERSDATPVPGCTGDGNPGSDYCYAASAVPSAVPTIAPSASPSPSSSGSASASASASASPSASPSEILLSDDVDGLLNLCEGDCNDDRDCAAGLKCYQTSSSTSARAAVPGCEGEVRNGVDYCTVPNLFRG